MTLRSEQPPYAIGSYVPPRELKYRCPDCVTQGQTPCPHAVFRDRDPANPSMGIAHEDGRR